MRWLLLVYLMLIQCIRFQLFLVEEQVVILLSFRLKKKDFKVKKNLLMISPCRSADTWLSR